MRGYRKFCKRGSIAVNVFFVCCFFMVFLFVCFFVFFFDELTEDINSIKRGPSFARERNAI